MDVHCADCGDRLQVVVIPTRWGASWEIVNVSEVWQMEPSRCVPCLRKTAERVEAIADRVAPLLMMSLLETA